MLCVGKIIPPWKRKLSLDDYKEEYSEIGYVNAYSLWLMCVFDDDLSLQNPKQENDIKGKI